MVRASVTSSFFQKICEKLHRRVPRSVECGCACLNQKLGIRHYSTHYETLGINKNAKASDIKKAYIKKTKAHHPDVLDSDDGEKFLKIAEAYEVLSNASSRREYDYKTFGMSSQYNRFESGEYNIPLYDSPERKMRYEQMKQKQKTGKPSWATDTRMNLSLSPRERKVLDYLLGILISVCIAMYLISRYQRENANEKSSSIDDEKD